MLAVATAAVKYLVMERQIIGLSRDGRSDVAWIVYLLVHLCTFML